MSCFPTRISTCLMFWSELLRQASSPFLLEKIPESQSATGNRPSHVDVEGCWTHALVSYSENGDGWAWFICDGAERAEKKTASPPNERTATDKRSHVINEMRLIRFNAFPFPDLLKFLSLRRTPPPLLLPFVRMSCLVPFSRVNFSHDPTFYRKYPMRERQTGRHHTGDHSTAGYLRSALFFFLLEMSSIIAPMTSQKMPRSG